MTIKDNYNRKITVKELFWQTLLFRNKIVGCPRYWIIEDMLYHWAFLLWLRVKYEYRALPRSYDAILITANVLGYMVKKLRGCETWLIRIRLEQLKAEYRDRFGEEPE